MNILSKVFFGLISIIMMATVLFISPLLIIGGIVYFIARPDHAKKYMNVHVEEKRVREELYH